jgi:flagellin
MVSSINYYLYGLADIYNQNNLSLFKTLQRLASGKKFQTPSDDLSAFFRSQELDSQYRKYENIRPDMEEWKNVMNIASTAGGEVYNSLVRMKELSQSYDSVDDATKAQYTTEYNNLLSDVSKTVNTTYYDGTSLLNKPVTPFPLAPLKLIDLVPDATADAQRLRIDPGEAVAAADLLALTPEPAVVGPPAVPAEDIGDVQDHLNTAITDVKTFLGNISAYSTGLQSHLNITDSIMQNTQSVKSSITDIDQIAEMLTYTQEDIRNQAALAMMAQANVSQRSILYLYGMHVS